LINWILTELEKQPSRLFYTKELERIDAGEFARLRQEKILAPVKPDTNDTYGLDRPLPLRVKKTGNQYWGFSEDDPEGDPVLLDRSELVRYRLSLKTFAILLAITNGFSGSPEKLHRRLYYAGERKIDGSKVALVLAFIDQEKSAENILLGLPGRLPSGFNQFYVVTPSYAVESLKLRERLGQQRILVTPLKDFGGFKIDLSPLAKEGAVVLTPQQEEECRLYGFIYKIPIHITGERSGKASNYVSVGDTRVRIGDSPFALFLRLVLGLHEVKTGDVPKADLYYEGFFQKDEDEYQKIDRLRQCFQNISGIERLKFIKDENKSLKLSVHPCLITWDIERLSNHTDGSILKLVARLPREYC
jgi:hypothetical protein